MRVCLSVGRSLSVPVLPLGFSATVVRCMLCQWRPPKRRISLHYNNNMSEARNCEVKATRFRDDTWYQILEKYGSAVTVFLKNLI